MPAEMKEIQNKVKETLDSAEKMRKEGANTEDIIDIISATLEEINPPEEPIIEAAPLQYMLAELLLDVIQKRNESDEQGDDGLNEDDMEIAWENLESARLLYTDADDDKDYRKEISQIYAKQGEIEMEKGDFNSAIENHSKCLEIRNQIMSPLSRELADAYFYLGICQFYKAQSDALSSTDESELADEAKKSATESAKSLHSAQNILSGIAVCSAMEEGVMKKENVNGNYSELFAKLKDIESIPESILDLIDVVDDIKENILKAETFSVDACIEQEKSEIAKLREMINSEDDESSDTDGEEDEEDVEDAKEQEEDFDEDDDVVVEDMETLKKMLKRNGSDLPEGEKKSKH